jgi:predicted MFS family arabinose efflux permease
MFGMMSLSGILAILGGLVVRQVIGNPTLPFPADYRTLVLITLVGLAIGFIPLYLVDEPEGEPVAPPEEFGSYIRRLPKIFRSMPAFRRLVAVQLLVGTSALAVPFYAPFAVKALQIPESDVGIFIVGTTLGSMSGGFTWGYLADHGKKHIAIRLLAFFAMVAPVVALGLVLLASALPLSVRIAAMTVAMFAVGSSIRSSWVAFANVVMDLAETRERPVLIGLMNTLGGTLAVVPPIGGLLAGWFGYEATFAVASIPAATALFLSLGWQFPKSVQPK